MKSKWYFIIATAAVMVFAVWYRDFEQKDSRRRAAVAAAQAHELALQKEKRQREDAAARDLALRAMEERRRAREARAKQAAAELALREERQAEVIRLRDENIALRGSRDRLGHEIAALEARISTKEEERGAIAAEQAFLDRYLMEATASAGRLAVVAERAREFRIAQADAPEPVTRTR